MKSARSGKRGKPFKMRISIRNQLAALVLLSSLVCLAIISVSTWYYQKQRLSATRSGRFAIIASLKAAQLSSNLALMERSVRALSSRARVQNSLLRYNAGNNTDDNWSATEADLQSALTGQRNQLIGLQIILYPRNATIGGNVNGLLNVTSTTATGTITLPYKDMNGPVLLGQTGLGYPPDLYPNFTHIEQDGTTMAQFGGEILDADSALFLGPLQINSTSALFSLTLPVINNTSYSDILGYMSVVVDASLIYDVINSPIGLLNTGVSLLIGPNTVNNLLSNSSQSTPGLITAAKTSLPDIDLIFVLPPTERHNVMRHEKYAYGKSQVFRGSKYPLVLKALVDGTDDINDAGGTLSTRNEEGDNVGIGYAKPPSRFCDWVLINEFAHDESWGPINAIQNVLIACIFATAAGAALWTIPIAHFSSAPIRRLRDATKNAVDPSQNESHEYVGDTMANAPRHGNTLRYDKDGPPTVVEKGTTSSQSPASSLKRKRGGIEPPTHLNIEGGTISRRLKIPQRVKDRRHFVEDELTDLTTVFNEMCDELTMQYSRLEERVRQRTAELELSKKAAEAANESKTLFIANISHELKTPLNGILGMCAVAMAEEDPSKIKRSLNIIYKSGDLLHHLLTDLLTFSKHQVGKNLSLDEKEFRLRDVGSQLHAIFFTQARDGQIDFTVEYQGPQDVYGNPSPLEDGEYGPDSTGKVRDMVLWGDVQRILQVAINLISNSLKFTAKGGTVKLRIRCMEMLHSGDSPSRQPSLTPADRRRNGTLSSQDTRKVTSRDDQLPSRRASTTSMNSEQPPDSGVPSLMFEFEVEDTGPGIAPHLQSQIFQPFVQGDLRLTKKFGGTGLGLSICSQLSDLMHGNLRLRSVVDEGSTFTMRIPLRLCRSRADSSATSVADNAVANTIRTQSSPSIHLSRASSVNVTERAPSPHKAIEQIVTESKPRLVGLSQPFFSTGKPPMASPNSDPAIETLKKDGKLKVLVAEDNVTNAEVVTRMLKLEEVFDVSLAKDGQEALEKVKESMALGVQFDLIFMDVQMPNLDGRESTRLIRDLGYSAPIVALTAFSDEINQRECLDSGMDYFLPKPIKRPALKQVLKTYCPPIQEEDEPRSRKMSEMNPFARAVQGDRPPAPVSPHVDPKDVG